MTRSFEDHAGIAAQLMHRLPPMPEHPCAYIKGQVARDRGFAVTRMGSDAWQMMLDAGWRRAGAMVYEPACPFCRSCIPMRLRLNRFRPNRTQKRLLKRNADLSVRLMPITIDDERAELYRRYITTRHNGMMTGSRREFHQFLGTTPVDTIEVEYRLGERLLAVGTVDRVAAGWSCVYCYFDPEESKRSLGTFNVLKSVELCRTHSPCGEDSYLYLGYWIPQSRPMAYKAKFRQHEVRHSDGVWREVDEKSAASFESACDVSPLTPLRIPGQEGSLPAGDASSGAASDSPAE